MISRDRVLGMFLGAGVGDALGMPVETFSAEKIAENYGPVTDYLVPDGHKWFDGHEAGTTTDDTQLTLAVARALIKSNGLMRMKEQVEYHIKEFKKDTGGWGNSTREAVRRLANGAPHTMSGKSEGVGNGVAMKIAPVGVVAALNPNSVKPINFAINICKMTHRTSVAASSALAQLFAISYCLRTDVFDPEVFLDFVLCGSEKGRSVIPETLKDDMTNRLTLLKNYLEYDEEKCIAEFGKGSCYCYNSIPFTYAFFMRNPYSIESLYKCISAGGDTDSNGSMLAALLGALNGSGVFPSHLIYGLKNKDEVLEVANQFCNIFKIS